MSDEPHIGYTMQINMKTGEHTIKPDAPSELVPTAGSETLAQLLLRCLPTEMLESALKIAEEDKMENELAMIKKELILRAVFTPLEKSPND